MRYRIGTSNHWPNATIFWQIDQQQKVHTGKIMLYDYHTGHRVILFPDLGAEDKWREKAAKIPALKGCIISTWLANHASAVERERGLDLADYLEGLDARCKLRVEDYLE